jgi:Type III restriction enzyme, res subunit
MHHRVPEWHGQDQANAATPLRTDGPKPPNQSNKNVKMANPFFERPILNSPYECPRQHWELDDQGQPTQQIIETRRRAEFITPIPKPKKRKKANPQKDFVFDEGKGLSTQEQQYDPTSVINRVRDQVNVWRSWPKPSEWGVTPETALLLQHWRTYSFAGIRPFFCQVEAIETAIWLTEVAPKSKNGKQILELLAAANNEANPELLRFALKLATGAGKTTVMAMLIAWQTINAVRHPGSKTFTRGFLVVAPGLTIKDRLRVLQPNDPDSYYASRELVPGEMLDEVNRAKIVITNFHAFKLRERIELSAGGRSLLQGRGEELDTLETEGQMLQRMMPDLMGMKNILVLNDEAHHCYRAKPGDPDDEDLKGDERKEAEKNNKAASLWISGLEAVNRKLGLARVMDLSATPFFLRGSGYAEGTLFPWTVSDFSLMDAIECGIVKLPRVPVAENIPGDEMPVYRNLWENIRKDMPKKGRGQGEELDPLKLPTRLQTALQALYGHYEKTFKLWEERGIGVPPCFIIVCQNTAISKLVYDFVSGFHRKNVDDTTTLENGRLALFQYADMQDLGSVGDQGGGYGGGGAFSADELDQLSQVIRQIVEACVEDKLAFLEPRNQQPPTPATAAATGPTKYQRSATPLDDATLKAAARKVMDAARANGTPISFDRATEMVRVQYQKSRSSTPEAPKMSSAIPVTRGAPCEEEKIRRQYSKTARIYADKQRDAGKEITFDQALAFVKKNYGRNGFGGTSFEDAWDARTVSTSSDGPTRKLTPPSRGQFDQNSRDGGDQGPWAGVAPDYEPGVSAGVFFSADKIAARKLAFARAEADRKAGRPHRDFHSYLADIECEQMGRECVGA